MPTKPPTDLFDRDISKAIAREWIDLATPMLVEIVNHGVAAFARCSTTAKGGDEHLAILMPYRHLLEMIDGVQILLGEAAPDPAQLLLRSAFEALLTTEYITEADTVRRGHAYLVGDIRQRLATYRRMDRKTPEGKQMHERIDADESARDMRIPDIPDLDARIENLEILLKKPHWREADEQFQDLQRRLKRRPLWHHLYGGPENIEFLSVHLKRGGQYEILYRQWAKRAHAADTVQRILTKGDKGGPAFRRVRDPSEFVITVTLAVTFVLAATRRILSFYRPNEKWEQWYFREVRDTFLKFIGPEPEHETN